MSTETSKWHIDRNVPLAIIITLGLQTFGAVWWASSISSRVTALEEKSTKIETLTSTVNTIAVDVAGLKAKTDATIPLINNQLSDIKDDLGKLSDRILSRRETGSAGQ